VTDKLFIEVGVELIEVEEVGVAVAVSVNDDLKSIQIVEVEPDKPVKP
jgi:hypothetical protein